MSKLQLRSTRSRRRATSPAAVEDSKADVPSSKRPRKVNSAKHSESDETKPDLSSKDSSLQITSKVDLSESDSSSDEFIRPADTLKVNAGILSLRNGPSPEPDFSAIESTILTGVSRLSDSDSDNSDFEEVGVDSAPNSSDTLVKKESPSFGKDTLKAANHNDLSKVSSSKSDKSVNGKLSLEKIKSENNEKMSLTKSEPEGKKVLSEKNTKKVERVTRTSRKTSADKTMKTEFPESSKSVSDKKQTTRQSSSKLKEDKKSRASASSKSSTTQKTKKEDKIRNSPIKKEVPESLDTMDIAQLLALGEGLKMDMKSPLPSDSESEDWEEVDQADQKKHEIPKEGVQITLDMPEFSWKRKKQRDQQACMQAEMNRAFNRVRRELQLLCHKTSLLLWVAHGRYLNNVINNDGVQAIALSLVPTDLTVLPKKPGRKYVDLLLKWFAKDFECSEGFPETLESSQSRPLGAILAQHFSRKYAKSTRELIFMFIAILRAVGMECRLIVSFNKTTTTLIFMFIAILRAVGMECRLIVSFQPMPLKPQSNELLAISTNGKRGKPSKKKNEEDDEVSEKQSSPQTPGTSKTAHSTIKCKSAPNNDGKSSKYFRKSAPASSESISQNNDGPKKESSNKRKSESSAARSPVKTRGLRRKASEKKYKEKTDSESESDPDDPGPILSPGKKQKLDQDSSQRLKEAAAKRVPPSKRSISKKSVSPGPSQAAEKLSKTSESESDFKVKRFSLAGTSKPSTSSKPSGSRRSISQESDSDSDFEKKPKSKQTSKTNKSPATKPSGSRRSRSQESDSDSDFEEKSKSKQTSKTNKSPAKKQPSRGRPSKGSGKKVLSSDDNSENRKSMNSGSDYWVEVYLNDEDRWTCVDVPSKKIDSTKQILLKASQPVCYVIAFNADGTLKDVTKRYSPKYSQVTVKQRVSVEWWDKTLKPFRPKHSRQEAAEDSEMNLVELDRPMPKTVGECKNHPLYVLKRHLLKFEAIYPADSPSLGFVRGEPVYARQNVYTLHSREIWMKDAKVVRLGQQPYKIVKARPKWDRLSGKVITDLPLEVFGPWQVEDYVPPPAKDGKVPRNAYGNVELFKPTMLPKGTVHLQVPFLSRVAKKLRIDCAPAVVGFDYHSGGCHPTYDGFVVCEEFVDVLMDAWNKEIDESAKRREEKHEKRVYGNWRRLIKGLLIREHLKYRYDFKEEGAGEAGCSQSLVNADALKASRIQAENAPLPPIFPKLMANIKNKKTQRRTSTTKANKNQTKSLGGKEGPKGRKGKQGGGKKKKVETSEEEEESDWDTGTTSEDETEMVLLSDEDSGSEFEDLKNKK
ncbi:LOW QUALITY PROTEIN: DNA repair protein complementing XP-C cells homolog [Frankliniella occidentalis]|uniref:LOW QUALITY PROTEIN: DNA repair protein complementing XP-C cells homolog n=1 Tax=Frankliniella occidentalis TaxID=133901 RepID=A0A6J1T6W7_FRAOC|nr:LOW QUALITY PROTEIN: DNA repair protein complementing XP-C cells homolog [Frankliniella occidentalis]